MTPLDSNKKVLVVGLGKSGVSALRLLREGFRHQPDRLKVLDEAPGTAADFSSGEEVLKFDPDFVILSPGYPRAKAWVQQFLATKGDAALISELDLANLAVRTVSGSHERLIGITGSAGKSTTAALVAGALQTAGHRVFLGGNFGVPYCNYAYEVVCKLAPRADFVVLELSSYQLETLKMGFEIGVITAFSRNHLDRYPSLEAYYGAKALLWDRTSGGMILNPASPDLVEWFSDPFYRDDRRLWWTASRAWAGQKLLGKHNEQNLNLAAEVLDHLKIDPTAYESLLRFEGLPHRLENCGFRDGILFVNDSKATTIESVLVAVEALRVASVGRLHLLLGGKDKDLPWENLAALKLQPALCPWFFGEAGGKAKALSGLGGEVLSNLEEFFEKRRFELKAGDVVLLSPGGSSLDQYKNFEQRGDHFKTLVTRYILT